MAQVTSLRLLGFFSLFFSMSSELFVVVVVVACYCYPVVQPS